MALVVSPGLQIPEHELSWTAVRASGPGGQNVNKVSSKVELRFDVRASTLLSNPAKARLAALAGQKLDRDGVLLVTSQKTRDQARNLEDAREKLALLVGAALVVPKHRRPTKPTRSSDRRRLDEKKRDGAKKAGRQTRGDDG